jgi:hypothetical protein
MGDDGSTALARTVAVIKANDNRVITIDGRIGLIVPGIIARYLLYCRPWVEIHQTALTTPHQVKDPVNAMQEVLFLEHELGVVSTT